MRYFIDTEFVEDGKTIDLISIGIVSECAKEYYAISTQFQPHKAEQWVKDNVLNHLPPWPKNYCDITADGYMRWLPIGEEQQPWRSRKQIAQDILDFVSDDLFPEFWAYYADYDWVAFCQLYGRMIDLPKRFPKFCRDIKQWSSEMHDPILPDKENEHHALHDARWAKSAFEKLQGYALEDRYNY